MHSFNQNFQESDFGLQSEESTPKNGFFGFNLNPVPDFLQGLRSFCQICESRFCFRSPAWVFLTALAKKPSKMAMAGEDLDSASKQDA